MLSVLICSERTESISLLKRFLKTCDYGECVSATTAQEAKKQLTLHSFTLIIVDLPFTKDAHEMSFLLNLQETSNTSVLALIQKQHVQILRERVEKFGIFTAAKPLVPDVLQQFLSFVSASYYRMNQINRKQEQLVDKIREIKLVDKAKCLLIEHEYLSEEAAHKQIEKTAMNERVSRGVIAKRIIQEYEK